MLGYFCPRMAVKVEEHTDHANRLFWSWDSSLLCIELDEHDNVLLLDSEGRLANSKLSGSSSAMPMYCQH
jgi:hypothetical protein